MKFLFVALPIGLLLFLFISHFLRSRASGGNAGVQLSPRRAHRLLLRRVRFYQNLSPEDRSAFRQRIIAFLEAVRITPAQGVKLRMLDRIYVASAAIMPVFRKPDWVYPHLNEVVVRSGNFSRDFAGDTAEQNVLGMVGDGAMHRMMVISLDALRTGFEQQGRGNTAIHEFVHLIDKADGIVDGAPEVLLPESLAGPWLTYMQQAITDIREGKNRDINEYGGTSEAEFLAVVSEYYFQRPAFLKEAHPELWELLDEIYGTHPALEPKETPETTGEGGES